MSVLESVQAEVAKLPDAVRLSATAATAEKLAERLDEATPRDTAPIARELRETLAQLSAWAEKVPTEADPLDELERKRAARIADPPVSKRATGTDKLGPRGGRPRRNGRSDPGSGTS